jgi:hypothetical protein
VNIADRRVPVFVWVGAAVMACLIAALVAAGVWLAHLNAMEDRRECLETVAERKDDRAMWEWLIEAVGPANRLRDEAVIQINTRIPMLGCNDDHQAIPLLADDIGD